MPIRYRCPSCGQLLGISSRMAGRELPCPTCGEVSVVPDGGEPQPFVERESLELQKQNQPAGHDVPVFSGSADERVATSRVDHDSARQEPGDPGEDSTDNNDSEGFRIVRRSLESDEMDLTPMVDMTFLLLIFFMITASFSVQKSIAFPPPSPDQKGAVQATHTLEEFEEKSVVIRIDDRNVIFVDDEPVSDPRRLIDVLKSSLSKQRNEVIVTADDHALHDTVVSAIDAANGAGMQRIRLASRGAE